jgi:hypothetical protein
MNEDKDMGPLSAPAAAILDELRETVAVAVDKAITQLKGLPADERPGDDLLPPQLRRIVQRGNPRRDSEAH